MSAAIQRKLATEVLDQWLALPSQADLQWALRGSDAELTLPQARRLEARMLELGQPTRGVRLAVLRTYTSDLLDPWLGFEFALQGLSCTVHHAPYGFIRQEAESGSGTVQHAPDITLLLLQREDLHPALGNPLGALSPTEQADVRVDALAELMSLLAPIRQAVGGLVVVTFLPAMVSPGLGLFDATSERSESAWWASFKAEAARAFRDQMRSALLLDLDDAVAQLGRERFFDARFWMSSRFPFSAAGAREVARRLAALGAVMKHPRAKVIVLDADNTLWGGIIGEDGLHGIALGPDYPGSGYLAFQRRLLALQQRGFILAICSKNNEADLDQVLREHPHQVLREEHFVARRVNWLPKPQNLESLAEELNVGLDSFVFVDDSEHECLAVRSAWPQVEVIRTPSHPLAVAACLDRVARLEIVSLTAEDRAKTQMYVQERQRRELARDMTQAGGDFDSYLRSLGMRMQIGIDDPKHITRLAQLTQKTNQFNLTTHRYSEEQIRAFVDDDEALVAHFTLTDRFGNSGVVGLAILRRAGSAAASLDTFLMSCRVIGRKAESAFLESLLRELHSVGVASVFAEFIPTAKNSLASGFLASHGFTQQADESWLRTFDSHPPSSADAFPIETELTRSVSAGWLAEDPSRAVPQFFAEPTHPHDSF